MNQMETEFRNSAIASATRENKGEMSSDERQPGSGRGCRCPMNNIRFHSQDTEFRSKEPYMEEMFFNSMYDGT
jgi:hypothetical protein